MPRSKDSGGNRTWGDLDRHDTRQRPGKVQVAVMVASAIFTLAVFGYAGWHAWTTPEDGPPNVEVLSVEEKEGLVRVHVALSNPAEPGLREAEVMVECGGNATSSRSLTFTNVPPGGRRKGWVTCPAGTAPGDVRAVVTSWTPA